LLSHQQNVFSRGELLLAGSCFGAWGAAAASTRNGKFCESGDERRGHSIALRRSVQLRQQQEHAVASSDPILPGSSPSKARRLWHLTGNGGFTSARWSLRRAPPPTRNTKQPSHQPGTIQQLQRHGRCPSAPGSHPASFRTHPKREPYPSVCPPACPRSPPATLEMAHDPIAGQRHRDVATSPCTDKILSQGRS